MRDARNKQSVWSVARIGAGLLLAVALLTACSTVPKQQTLAFSDMVSSVGTTVDPLLDKVSAAEKRHKLQAIAAHPTSSFSVDDAEYYSTVGDAPAAGQLRAGFGVIQGYTKLLVSLVDGSSAAVWQAEASSILGNITSLTGSSQLGALAGPLNQIFGQIAVTISNAQARRLVLDGKDEMIGLIDAMINAGDPIFFVLVEDDQPFAGSKSKDQRKADIDAARVEVSNYIVLLRKLREQFGQLSAAYLKQSSVENLAAIAQTSGALAADAKSARAAFAALNAR